MPVSGMSQIWSLSVWHDFSRGRRRDGYGIAETREAVTKAGRHTYIE